MIEVGIVQQKSRKGCREERRKGRQVNLSASIREEGGYERKKKHVTNQSTALQV